MKALESKIPKKIKETIGLFQYRWHRIVLDECHHIKVLNLFRQKQIYVQKGVSI